MSDPKIERVWTALDILEMLNHGTGAEDSRQRIAAYNAAFAEHLAKCTRLMAAFSRIMNAHVDERPDAEDAWDYLRAAIEAKDEP